MRERGNQETVCVIEKTKRFIARVRPGWGGAKLGANDMHVPATDSQRIGLDTWTTTLIAIAGLDRSMVSIMNCT